MKKLKEQLESYLEDVSLMINPCKLCAYKKEGTHSQKCIDCCFFYGSQFLAKDIIEEDEW